MFSTQQVPRMFLIGVGVIVLATALCIWWLLRDRDVIVFDALAEPQLNAISAELDRASIPYQLERESGAVKVSPADEQRARLAIMSSGNAFRDAVGFELFNGSDFGMTEFAQKINYQRAMEGELSRTIGALQEIKYARVHLVLPEHGLFRSQQQEPRAAVTVFPEQGVVLGESQVRGIRRLTASAIPELQERNVTILDESGAVLSRADADDNPIAGNRLAQKQAIERYLTDKIRDVLGKALGAEHFAVSVDVILDYSQKTTTTERVLDAPAGAAIKHAKETSRSGADDQKEEHQKEIEYNAGREVEQIIHGVGSIRRLQAGVIVDEDAGTLAVEQLHELVAAAVGADSGRGDKVTVVRHGLAVQQAIERAVRPAAAVEMGSSPSAAAGRMFPERWLAWLVVALLGLTAGGVIARRLAQRQRLLRHQQLRRQLHAWIESEPTQVNQP